jgi:aspartyl-tRNA(Asn)/glutamyl-tRNA(Gln) amidotransferase subunit C
MASTFSRDDVRRVAALARLEVTDTEIDRLASEISAVLDCARDVQAVDTTGVAPYATAPAAGAWRDDAVAPSLDRQDALGGAPSTAAGLFRVPGVW